MSLKLKKPLGFKSIYLAMCGYVLSTCVRLVCCLHGIQVAYKWSHELKAFPLVHRVNGVLVQNPGWQPEMK